jgi:hypothetical protein
MQLLLEVWHLWFKERELCSNILVNKIETKTKMISISISCTKAEIIGKKLTKNKLK